MNPVRSVFILLAITLSLPCAAEDDAGRATLFLSSSPINAQVILDGTPLAKETPLLLRDLAAGEHSFEVRKEGYPTRVAQVELAAGEVKGLVVDLSGGTFQASFPNEQSLLLAGKEEPAAGVLFRIPEGRYRIRRDDERLRLEPEYRYQGLLTGLHLALPLSLAFSGVLTLYDVLHPPEGPLPVSAATLSAWGVTVGVAGFDLVLALQRRAFRKRYVFTTQPLALSAHVARELYEKAESLLALDRREEALYFYSLVVHEHPDSPYLPQALFKTAKIHLLTGDGTLAALELLLLVNRYPLPDLYDKAQKTLADLYLRQGLFKDSLARLEAMLFADPLYARQDIEQYAAQIREQWRAQDPAQGPPADGEGR